MRIFAVSDIHIDFPENEKWLGSLSEYDHKSDILIMAGDISHDTDHIRKAFLKLRRCFSRVFFVPGNHDLWLSAKEKDSIRKYESIEKIADDHGVETKAGVAGHVLIIPMLSWYDLTFGPLGQDIKEAWQDFVRCRWPEGYDLDAITRFFLEKNPAPEELPESSAVITFSHFVPRIDVMPSYIPEHHRIVYPVLGTTKLEQALRSIGPDIHVYGHSHVNRNIALEGITYINSAFGYPHETRICKKQLMELTGMLGS